MKDNNKCRCEQHGLVNNPSSICRPQDNKWEEELDDIHLNIRVLLHGSLIGAKLKTNGDVIECLLPHLKSFIEKELSKARQEGKEEGDKEWLKEGIKANAIARIEAKKQALEEAAGKIRDVRDTYCLDEEDIYKALTDIIKSFINNK